MLRIWTAIAGPPCLALTALAIAYALVAPACGSGSIVLLHTVFGVALGGCLACAALAVPWPGALFYRRLALGSAGFFAATLAMQWMAVLWLPPCLA